MFLVGNNCEMQSLPYQILSYNKEYQTPFQDFMYKPTLMTKTLRKLDLFQCQMEKWPASSVAKL